MRLGARGSLLRAVELHWVRVRASIAKVAMPFDVSMISSTARATRESLSQARSELFVVPALYLEVVCCYRNSALCEVSFDPCSRYIVPG